MTTAVAPAPTAAPLAPAAAPAPAPSGNATGPFAVDDLLNSIAASATAEAVRVDTPPATPGVPQRDEKTGKFVKAEAAPGEIVEVPVEGAPVEVEIPAEEEPAPLELPEGYAAVKPITRELHTQFKLYDAEGEIAIPDVQIEFKANGKVRKESLDKVVRMAEWGVYNHEREQSAVQARQQMDTLQQEHNQAIQYARQLEAERERLLSSDEAYLSARVEFDARNTPEARVQRAEESRAHAEQRAVFVQVQADGSQFFHGTLLPAVEMIAKALPLVSDEEIGAKLLLVTDRYKVHTPFGSVIPPKSYGDVSQAIAYQIVPWAQQLQEHRSEQSRSASEGARREAAAKTAAADKDKRTAQVDAQKAKNQLGRVLKPGQRAATSATPSPREKAPPAPIRTVDDAEQAALREALAAMV